MSSRRLRRVPDPIIDERERQQLALLTARYEKLVEPGPVRQLATKVAKSLPEPVKKAGESIKDAITEQELYEAALEVIGEGFDAVQKQAARFSVSEERIVEQVGQTVEGSIESLDEVCLARSYDVSSIVSKRRASNIAAAFAEGAATGAPGFVGIPFNLVLSTFCTSALLRLSPCLMATMLGMTPRRWRLPAKYSRMRWIRSQVSVAAVWLHLSAK